MATTGPGSAHRHMTKASTWSDLTDAASGSLHTHTIDLAQYDQAVSDLAALIARVTALEAPAPPPPVPTNVVATPGDGSVTLGWV